MTLSSTTTKATYNGDGSTTAFAVPFIFWNNSDLRVIHRDALGVETVWVEATQYTLTGGSGATGTLTVKTSPTDYTPASGETLTIKDYQSEVQGDSLPLSGAFPSTVVEQRLDKITRLIQIHSEEIARSILLPETASLSGLQLPEPGAGELVRYNAGGTDLETVAVGDISTAIDTLLTGLATNDFLYWDNAQSAWVNLAPGATGLALLQDASAADARAGLELGTAALIDTGALGASMIAAATAYPAGDGALITSLVPSAAKAPPEMSNGADADHDIDIAAGYCRADDAEARITNGALTIAIDSAGDGGRLDTDTLDADTWYNVMVGRETSGGTIVGGFKKADAKPAAWDYYRRLGSVLTDGASNIVAFFQDGDVFRWDVRVLDESTGAPGTAGVLLTTTVPLGHKVEGIYTFTVYNTATGEYIVTSPDETDTVPTTTMYDFETSGGDAERPVIRLTQRTNTSSQIRYRSSDAALNSLKIFTLGYIDPRGRNA